MFGKLGDMMGQLQEMKRRAEDMKAKLDATVLEVSSAGGDIKITISGSRKIRSISIAPAVQHGEREGLEEMLTIAVNKAIETADKLNEEELKKAAGGLLPGMV